MLNPDHNRIDFSTIRSLFKHRQRYLLSFLIFLILLFCFSTTISAKVTGFVALGSDGRYYSYEYEALIDSYAMKLLGRSNGLYDHFADRSLIALKDSINGYIDYNDVLDRYAAAVMAGKRFDIHAYTESGKAVKAQLPDLLVQVELSGSRLVKSDLPLNGSPVVPVVLVKGEQPGPGLSTSGGSDGETTNGAGQQDGETKEPEKPVTITPITGSSEVTLAWAQTWARSRGAQPGFVQIAPLYWHYGALTGIRPEVLYAQAALETGFGRFGGLVPPEYNNWAGIKTAVATGNEPEDHQQFATPEDGVRAHFNHMAAYVGLPPVGEPHGRYYIVARLSWAGTVRTVEELSGKWAPSGTYHERIVSMIESMQ